MPIDIKLVTKSLSPVATLLWALIFSHCYTEIASWLVFLSPTCSTPTCVPPSYQSDRASPTSNSFLQVAYRMKSKFFPTAQKALTLSLVLSLSPSQAEFLSVLADYLTPHVVSKPMFFITLTYLLRIYFAPVSVSARNPSGNK